MARTSAVAALRDRLVEVEAERDRLRDLIRFARHASTCPNEFAGKVRPELAICNCGFQAALAALEADRG